MIKTLITALVLVGFSAQAQLKPTTYMKFLINTNTTALAHLTDLPWTNSAGTLSNTVTASTLELFNAAERAVFQARSAGNSATGGLWTTVIGGSNNRVESGDNSIIVGGDGNRIGTNAQNCSVVASHNSRAMNTYANVLGGVNNFCDGDDSVIAGGTQNYIDAGCGWSSILVGDTCTISNRSGGDYYVILGGFKNAIIAGSAIRLYNFILGGQNNAIKGVANAWIIGNTLTNVTDNSIEMGFSDANKTRITGSTVQGVGNIYFATQTGGVTAGGVADPGAGNVSATNSFISSASNKADTTAISVTASVFHWTNTAVVNVFVFLDAHAATTMAVSINSGTTIFAGAQDCTIPLQPGESIDVTYTGTAPTARWKPW